MGLVGERVEGGEGKGINGNPCLQVEAQKCTEGKGGGREAWMAG